MIKWWYSTRTVLAVAGVVALSLLINLAVVRAGATKMIVPTPDSVAEQMVRALGAHRYEGAIEQLADELETATHEEDLKASVRSIEQAHGRIDQVEGQPGEEQGDTATARVEVTFENGEKREASFPLKKENAVWKISGLDGLNALAE